MSKAATPIGTDFNPVDITAGHELSDGVESPSLSSSNALARFEFEPGRSKEGTKVLMVEWEDDETTKRSEGDWEISWQGKKTVLPAREQPDEGGETPVNRLYFLLGAGVPVPTAVHLRKGTVSWRTNPLPAIFAPELGATARQAGKRGVLHTIWAKKRLQVLQREIDNEAHSNAEGIALEMAVAEKEWIEQNFGVNSRPSALVIPSATAISQAGSNGPASPRTPGGGRLMEKLKGLKLGTSERELSSPLQREENNAPQAWHNPLSPEGSDVAVGSFGSFAALKGAPPSSALAAKPAQTPAAPATQQQSANQPPPRRFAAQSPPGSFAAHQRQEGGMGSLNALAASSTEHTAFPKPSSSSSSSSSSLSPPTADDEKEDDLFALPMSPRSPEMTKSPFSFATQDTTRYLKEEKA